jgi:metal-sulfur cluster biosynthetic enzyme
VSAAAETDASVEAAVRRALEKVVDPCSIATGVPINLADMGMIKEIVCATGNVKVILRLTSPICWQAANILRAVEEAIMRVDGVHSVTCTLDPGAEWMPEMMSPDARAARLDRLRSNYKVSS